MPEQKRPGAVDASINRALELGEVGLQVAAYIGDECIVDAWAGNTASNNEMQVQRDTLFPVFSVSKAFVATAVHLQAERGLIDYDAPLSRWWPEYTGSGRESVTIRHVLTHRAGVPQMPKGVNPERLADWSWMVKELAEIEPAYPPGTHNTYLSMSFGWLLGEIVCRSDPLGRPFGQFIREELCAPLGMDDFWMGLPASEEWRVAELSYPNAPPAPPEGSLVRQAVPPHRDFQSARYSPSNYSGRWGDRQCSLRRSAIRYARRPRQDWLDPPVVRGAGAVVSGAPARSRGGR